MVHFNIAFFLRIVTLGFFSHNVLNQLTYKPGRAILRQSSLISDTRLVCFDWHKGNRGELEQKILLRTSAGR